MAGSNMKIKVLAGFLIATALLFATLVRPQSAAPQPADAAQREFGKQAFTSHCGKCHDADAAKKLPDGSTLLARLAASKDPKARLATRTKSLSEQEARGIDLYMENLIAAFKAGQKPPADR
jgi:mono/diheme cytochrome c family protein